jgi:heptose I phosphotransferase
MTMMWITESCREHLQGAGLATIEGVMSTTEGRCLRVLADRENWHLPGIYLKKHRTRTWRSRLAARLGFASPASPGRIEAENARALTEVGIDVMPLTAYGEKLHADGLQESFLLSKELEGYCELQDFITRRFQSQKVGHGDCEFLRRLIVQVADIAQRFHAAGFNHRDFYCCHFLVKEIAPGKCDVRLIDLQRVQWRRWFRRRWIVKDLAQLASMSPDDQIGCREKMLFLRTYLGVAKLRPHDKRFIRDVLRKLASIRRRTRITTRSVSEGTNTVPRLRFGIPKSIVGPSS